jgi:hypothetical protein
VSLPKVVLGALVGAALSGCDAILTVEDHGPPLIVADVPISTRDVPDIIGASRIFARENGLSFKNSGYDSRFTIFMQRDRLTIYSYNGTDKTTAVIGASDDGQMKKNHVALAKAYVDLVRSLSSLSRQVS